MKYLTIEQIKRQLVIDESFTDDDILLTDLGTAAEEMVSQEINESLDKVIKNNKGELPAPLRQAMLMYVDYFYATNRGSAGEIEIPNSIFRLCQMYRNYK